MTSYEKFEELRKSFLPRFYDTENKVMIYPEWLEDDNCMTYRMVVKGEQFRFSTLLDFMIFCADLIMMKPTGLKDKNGKLIYEGDCFYPIIPSDDCEGLLEEEKCYVKWFANSFCLVSMKTDEYIGGVCNCKKLKIISNIHENKE